MVITGIEPLVITARLRNWVIVKITTDDPELIGWGEASLEWKTNAVVGAIRDLANLLIGQDPLRIEYASQVWGVVAGAPMPRSAEGSLVTSRTRSSPTISRVVHAHFRHRAPDCPAHMFHPALYRRRRVVA